MSQATHLSELHRSADALLSHLWQMVYSSGRTHDENWTALERQFPGAKRLNEAVKEDETANEPLSSDVSVSKPFAYAHPNGAIWRLDNCPTGIEWQKDGWFPLFRAQREPFSKKLYWYGGFGEKFVADADGRPMYEIGPHESGGWYWLHNWHGLAINWEPTLNEAQAAAEADFQYRINKDYWEKIADEADRRGDSWLARYAVKRKHQSPTPAPRADP